VGSLLLTNRQDLMWLIGPCLVAHLWREREARRWRALAIGIAPLALWEIISVVYYGFPVPNTAFAKLGTGIPETDLLWQGMWYLQESWMSDPLTMGAIFVSMAAGALRRQTWPLAIGQALYLLYVVWIGGDFMSGRFLAAPLLAGAGVLALWPAPRARLWPWAIPATIVLFGLASPMAPYRSGPRFGEQRVFKEFHGITDERPVLLSAYRFASCQPRVGSADSHGARGPLTRCSRRGSALPHGMPSVCSVTPPDRSCTSWTRWHSPIRF
jgi:arabinofuranosyltransferase